MNEVWKKIEEFSRFEASNTGQVRRKRDKAVLKQSEIRGRMRVALLTNSGKKTTCEVGKLVLSAFSGYKETSKYMANHLDGNPKNNNIQNLRWEKRARKSGKVIYLRKSGVKHEYRTFKNAGKLLGIEASQANIVTIKRAAKSQGYSVEIKEDRKEVIEDLESCDIPGTSDYDKRFISSPEVKQQIRDEVDKFVSYCDTHYSTCNEVERKGCIQDIDESDPVVIRFRTFMKNHNM